MKNHVKTLSIAALMASLTFVGTCFIQIPVPLTQDYIHAGDGFILLAAFLLPLPYAVGAAAVGASLADLLSPYAVWAPWTFFIKALACLACAPLLKAGGKKALIGCALFAVLNTGGYFIAGWVLYGSAATALLAMPFTFMQSVAASILFYAAKKLLEKTGGLFSAL